MLTKISNDMIKHFLNQSDINKLLKTDSIREIYDTLIQKKYHNSELKTQRLKMKFPFTPFVAKSLSKKIEKKKKVLYVSWITYSKYKIENNLYIYLDDYNKIPNIELLVNSISFITSYSNSDHLFKIHLSLLNDKKIIRKNQKKLTRLNINSGSNKFNHYESEICIFRKEECIKVVFHEIIHGLHLSRFKNDNKITERLCQKYNLESENILLEESYTEFWAKIFNCLFISSLSNDNKFQNFCLLLSIEIVFSIYQANKIKKLIKKMKDKNIDKDTNVSAYFLVVSELFCDIDNFLKLCNNEIYVNDYDKYLDYFHNLDKCKNKKINEKDKFYNTMRMSVSELQI